MSRQSFPVMVDQPGCTIRNFKITGATVGATDGVLGLDGRGKFLCTIYKLANVVTITWNPAFGDEPYVIFQPLTALAVINVTSSTASTLVYTTTTSNTGAALNDVDLYVTVFSYNTTAYVS
jgi:hypothetical protein